MLNGSAYFQVLNGSTYFQWSMTNHLKYQISRREPNCEAKAHNFHHLRNLLIQNNHHIVGRRYPSNSVVGHTTPSNTPAGSNLSVISFLCGSTNTYIVLFRVLNWNITYTKKRELHTKGTESSAETTIDDIQIATTADVPYTRAEYDLSESNCTRIVFRITHNR